MASVQQISQLSQDTTAELTANPWAWMHFLVTASKLYRYPFPDQLLIYAQRPDATACASFELWKNTMKRYVRRGSRGIALLQERGGYPRIRYVFDVSDTGELPGLSRNPALWTLKEQQLSQVSQMLQENYDAPPDAPLHEQLFQIGNTLAAQYYQDNEREILTQLESFLYDGRDTTAVAAAFQETLSVSLAYVLCNRCGLPVEQLFDAEDFPHLYHFSTLEAASCLGTAASELSEPILMDIGRTVKLAERTHPINQDQERNHDHEQHHLQAVRGLSDSQPDLESPGRSTAGQIRTDAAQPSETPPEDDLQRPSVIRFLAEHPTGSRPADTGADRASHERTDTAESAARQETRSDGVAGTQEQPAPAGGGTDSDRSYLEQISLFPSEQETIVEIAEANASAMLLSDTEIDTVLCQAIKRPESKQWLAEAFLNNPRSRDTMKLLKAQYQPLSFTMRLPDGQTGDLGLLGEDTGVVLSKGDAGGIPLAERTPAAILSLSWAKLHQRIAGLVDAGQFLEPDKLDFDAVTATILERVLSDENYVQDLAAAKTRAALRNPCGWAVEQAVRDHEQDEPAIFHQYFYDSDWRDRLLDRVLKGSYESRVPMEPTIAASPVAESEPIELTEVPQEDSLPAEKIPIGTELEIEGRRFRVDAVDYDWNTVSLQDVTFQTAIGFPIFRTESIAFVLQYWQPLTEPAQEPASAPVDLAASEPVPLSPTAQSPVLPEQEPLNYRITDLSLGTGGLKTKYQNNVEAIRTLKAIEAEHRLAALPEQEILSRYVGWGALAGAFTPGHPDWQKEYAELKELLTPEEYRAAKTSTLNAHYTSPVVIQAMYAAIEQMGFRQGNLLEPACGIGHFFGLLPEGMRDSRLYGVELDSITGRIAGQLYQNASITVSGFEKTELPNAFYDVAIGNVPFGGYKVADPDYDRLHFNIHDYFLAKSFDKVRPGGLLAFITTSGTMDRQNPAVRKYLAKRGELLGAIRLPNNAFLKNAGTEVTTDILFFKKRDRMMDIEPDWVHLGQTADGIPIGGYFADNPHMVLGTMVYDPSMYGDEKDTSCLPIEGADLSRQLQEAISHLHGEIAEVSLDDLPELEQQKDSIPADPDVKNYSFTVVSGDIYFRENSRMYRRDLPKTTAERVRHMVELRDVVRRIIDYQMTDTPDHVIQQEQERLNTLYDRFTATYGLLNSRGNSLAFSDDSAYYLLSSLELLDEDGKLEKKADLFHKRTIQYREPVTHVDTASEALAVSIAEKACVDLGFMHTLSGLSHEQIIRDLNGVIFRIPVPNAAETESIDAAWQTADAYLSGNVREKLAEAKAYAEQFPGLFEQNIEALTAAQPKELEAQEISVRLGAEWVGRDYIQQFMEELLEPGTAERDITVKYFAYTGEWTITGSRADHSGNVLAHVTYGTSRVSGYRLLENALNQRETRVYDLVRDGDTERRVLNKKETMLAQQKQEAVKEAFKSWIFEDANRRETLAREYNIRFNSIRPRAYDGSHITCSGMNPDITLRSHQRDAIAHVLYGGNTLLAHEVGAGKSFEMAAAAMESKRLGLASKSMFVVPNHLTEQMAAEFLRLYPAANILVARKKDFETKNRKKFCARIATGAYDAVIIGHSQFQKIPISKERQERLLNQQIDEIVAGIEEIKQANGERIWVKRLEQTKKSLEARLERLTDTAHKDDVVTFEELGVDRLFVDEAHNYKNMFLYTKMRNVAGLTTTDAQKSSDLFLKCRYLDELTGGKGIVFATGTPVSNSITELYTMMRYLQHDMLVENGFQHFDSWAAQFGETTTAIELAPEGTGYRARTRFSRFYNLPELMNLFKEAADIKTADVLDLPTPQVHYHTEVVQPSDIQLEMVADLSARATAIHDGYVDPQKDNMLLITSDGRKIGLDQRLMDTSLPDHPGSKVNTCVQNIHRIWQDTKAERSTQLVFCDMATPNKDGRFNVYDDMKQKLIRRGIPEPEIAFIHDAATEVQKRELFSKMRHGQIRVLFGSTFKLGSGTNIQDKLIAMHDADCPWRPADLAQRAGRIIRQGNENKEVHIYRYVTEKTFDAYLWVRHEVA